MSSQLQFSSVNNNYVSPAEFHKWKKVGMQATEFKMNRVKSYPLLQKGNNVENVS